MEEQEPGPEEWHSDEEGNLGARERPCLGALGATVSIVRREQGLDVVRCELCAGRARSGC
jgi:hypothetical protein